MAWHEGELAVQTRAGVAAQAQRVGRIIGETIPAAAAQFLAARPYVIVATVSSDGAISASILGGAPGFTVTTSERSIRIEPRFGHLAEVIAGLNDTGTIGLLAIDPANQRRMRANGSAAVHDTTIFMTTREVYSNCPQYIHPRTIEPQPAEAAEKLTGNALTADQQAWISRSDTLYIASAHQETGADASHRGGEAGFVRGEGANRLALPDYSGNNMFNTLGNLAVDPRCGLLFIDGPSGSTLQLRGRATLLWDDPRIAAMPGAERLVEIEVEEVTETRNALPLRWV